MSTTPPPDEDDPTPAERAALAHLAVLRGFPAEPPAGLLAGVLRSARWQRAALAPARVAAAIVSAVGASLAVLLGRPARGGRR